MSEQDITLQPSESKQVSFEAIPHEAKTYQVSVDGLTGSFRAMECTPGAAECREADLYVCSSQGRWELAEANSPQCIIIPPLQQLLEEIEAGTWTATGDELAAIADWPTSDYQAAIDAAYTHTVEEAARIEAETGEATTVYYSSEKGYYTAPRIVPWEDVPWDNWPDYWQDVPPWSDLWDNWRDVPWDKWDKWFDGPWDNWTDYWQDIY